MAQRKREDKRIMKRRISVAFSFLILIAIGAVGLMSPWARNEGSWGSVSDALFTSCSAVCVTGLSVVDIAKEFTREGLIMLLVLVEVGCLGLITCGTFIMLAIGRRISLNSEFSLMNAYGAPAVRGFKGLVVWVVISMLIIQALGATALYLEGNGVFESVFYSVMNFCNAGFSIREGSLVDWADDPLAIATMGVLVILGGIGFLVMFNLFTFRFVGKRGKGRLTLHTKTVLRFTFYLIIIAYASFLAVEWNNSLAGMATEKKLWVGLYQALTPRTCGFSIVPTESLQPVTRFMYGIMMFFGGAPGSACGGLKVTTLAVLVYTLFAMCRGDTETVIAKKTISTEVVREAIVILTALLGIILIATGALLVTENTGRITTEALFFEAVSAVTTTGLSIGDTTMSLSSAGRVVIMLAMFCGRLGALTVVMMIGDREVERLVRYPNEELVVG